MFSLGRSILLLFFAMAAGKCAQTGMLRVEVYDYAELEPKTLRQFLSSMEEILASSGVTVRVSLCRGSLISCDGAEGAGTAIRILPGEAKAVRNVRRPPLGQSFVDHRGGSYATVFLRTSKELAAAADVPWVVVLAHAAAHELGHLFLGGQAHTPRGLMKAAWDHADCRDMVQKRLHFTPEQARLIAGHYESAHRGPAF